MCVCVHACVNVVSMCDCVHVCKRKNKVLHTLSDIKKYINKNTKQSELYNTKKYTKSFNVLDLKCKLKDVPFVEKNFTPEGNYEFKN